MAELVVKIPEELEQDLADFPMDWEAVALAAIELKAFELRLQRSSELRKLVVEAISSKSTLTEAEADEFAVELGRKIKQDRLDELKRAGVL